MSGIKIIFVYLKCILSLVLLRPYIIVIYTVFLLFIIIGVVVRIGVDSHGRRNYVC